jgi:hypothetical protein
MTVFASSSKARAFDYQAGDAGYVPFTMGHYILNTGEEPLAFLEMFRSERFADISPNPVARADPSGTRAGAPEPGRCHHHRGHGLQGHADHRQVGVVRDATKAPPAAGVPARWAGPHLPPL